jgi:hypothetical protein
MAAQTMSAPPSPRWLPPPWGIPSGRKPAGGRRLIELVPVLGTWFSVSITWIVAWPPAIDQSLVVIHTVMAVLAGLGAILAVGYGTLIIATARRPRVKPVWVFPGLTSTPTAARWYGSAFLSPLAPVWAIALVAHFAPIASPTPTSPPSALFDIVGFSLSFGPFFAMLCFLGCGLLGRRAANRPIKQAILSGLAPSYPMAPGLNYWWDGTDWRSVADSAPEGALRSADGHYWWTGGYWVPMPPARRRTKPLKASVA